MWSQFLKSVCKWHWPGLKRDGWVVTLLDPIPWMSYWSTKCCMGWPPLQAPTLGQTWCITYLMAPVRCSAGKPWAQGIPDPRCWLGLQGPLLTFGCWIPQPTFRKLVESMSWWVRAVLVTPTQYHADAFNVLANLCRYHITSHTRLLTCILSALFSGLDKLNLSTSPTEPEPNKLAANGHQKTLWAPYSTAGRLQCRRSSKSYLPVSFCLRTIRSLHVLMF